MNVENALRKAAQKTDVIHPLIRQVAGIVVEAEARVVPHGFQRPLSAGGVEGDLGGMHFQREIHAHFLKHVQNGAKAPGEVVKAALPVGLIGGRKGVEAVPDARSGESRDHADAEFLRGAGGVHHLLGGPLAHAFRVAVTPDVGRYDGPVALVNRVADGLPDEVVADGVHLKAVLAEQVAHALNVAVFFECALHVEMVAPASEFQAVEAHLLGERREFGERQIGPLAGKQGDGSGHHLE